MNRHSRRVANSKRFAWFAEWRERGYTLERAGSGHLLARDPDGRRAATVSASPSDNNAHRIAAADLRRHERNRASRATG